jgi:ubiquinone/menaquinone biosynthesis C-methylase UbiE
MSTSKDPRSEHSSTYFVQDRSNKEELNRLLVQDRMLTASMGGVLTEQRDPSSLRRVLDVGCGTGGWLIDVAHTYPSIERLVGVDVSARMVDYARSQAKIQQIEDRVEFRTMDALLMLEFPPEYFDLVNQRTAAGYLRTWDWPKLLSEYWRVLRPEGVARITEGDWLGKSSSLALNRLLELVMAAFYQAGHSFTPTSDGVISELAPLLERWGFHQVKTRSHTPEYRAGTPEGQYFFEDMQLTFRTVLPFLKKWMRVPDDYQEIFAQALNDMQQPDFVATGDLLTAWGVKSSD